MEKQCEYCQMTFPVKRKDTRYCSHSCSQMAYIKRLKSPANNLAADDRKNLADLSKTSIDTSADTTETSTKNQIQSHDLSIKETENLKTSIDSLQNIRTDNKTSIDVSKKEDEQSIYPSIDPPENIDLSIDTSQNINNDDKISIEVSEKKDENSTDPSINTPQNINPSIDGSVKNVNNTNLKTSIDELSVNKIDVSIKKTDQNPDLKDQYEEVKSRFIEDLGEMLYESKRDYDLSLLLWKKCEASTWVSPRYKCLVECLLTISEMKGVHIDALKEICNAFTLMIQSVYFKYLPGNYPYRNEILELREALKVLCQNSGENEWIRFRFQAENKKKLIMTRLEMVTCGVPKQNFNELNFKQ